MKQRTFTTVLACLLVTLAGTGYTASVFASAASDCRQEALDYGIPAEGLDDYVDGCLASRGELVIEEAVSEYDAPPAEDDAPPAEDDAPLMETEAMPDPLTGDENVAQ
jgi:hypothetical protein